MSLLRDAAKKILPQPINDSLHRMRLHMTPITVLPMDRPKEECVDVEQELKCRESLVLDSNIKARNPYPYASSKREQNVTNAENVAPYFPECTTILNPYKNTPLCALVLFRTKEPVCTRFVVPGDKKENTITGELQTSGFIHRIPIFGLYPNRKNQVTIELLSNDESHKLLDTITTEIQTEPLPECLQDTVTCEQHNGPSVYSMILVSGKSTPYPYAFDSAGDIRYYMSLRPKGYGLIPLSGGRYIFVERNLLHPTYQLPHATQIYEIDLFGRVYRIFYIPKGAHHDFFEKTPGGNLFTITNSIKGHIGDVIIEIDRKTGEIVNRLDLRQIFHDVHRDNINWVHLNTIVYCAEDDSIIFNARNLHTACKVNWTTKEIVWIFCHPRFWQNSIFAKKVLRPIGDINWCFQSHAPYVYESNADKHTLELAIYDNHYQSRRHVSFYDDDEHSFVKTFHIDERRMTVKMTHSYPVIRSKITSNARIEKEKNRVFSMGAFLDPPFREGRGGLIDEFNMKTGKLINEYSVRYYYYRGYEFAPDYEMLSKPMTLAKHPVAGFLIKPRLCKKKIEIPKAKLSDVTFEPQEQVTFTRMGSVIAIGTKDHLLGQVFFIGKNHTYCRDLREPPQTDERFEYIVYSVGFPVHMMPPDNYQIVIDFKGKMYDTEKYVTIQPE